MKGSERLVIVFFSLLGLGALVFSGYLLFHELFLSSSSYESATEEPKEKAGGISSLPGIVKKALIHSPEKPAPLELKPAAAPEEKPRESFLPANLLGIVVDKESKPVPNTFIRVLRQEFLPFLPSTLQEKGRTITDEWGAFSFSGIPPGKQYALELVHSDFAPLQKQDLEIPEKGALDVGTLVLSRGGILFGQITGGEGLGLPEALVFMRDESEEGGAFRFSPNSRFISGPFEEEHEVAPAFRSGENGDYLIPHVPSGKISLLVLSPGHSPGQSYTVEVEEGIEKKVDIVLEPGFALQGEVVDPGKNPIKGAQVSLLQSMNLPNPLKTITDGEGRFSFGGIGEGRITLLAEAEGFAIGRQRVNVSKGEENFATITLQPNGSISGIVREEGSGKPVPGAKVKVVSASPFFFGTLESEKEGKTDDEGRFKIENVSQGAFKVLAWANGFAPSPSEAVEVSAGRETAEVVVFLKEGATIKGVVVDGSDYSPLQGATLVLRKDPLSGWANSRDREYFRSLFPFAYENRNRRIQMPWQNSPFENLQDPFPIEKIQSGEGGSFSFVHVSEGEYFLDASLPGYCPAFSDSIKVTDGAIIENLRVVCFQGGTIRGTAKTNRGSPLSGREVVIRGIDSPGLTATTNEKGEFIQDGLVPGEYSVHLVPKGGSGRMSVFFSAFSTREESPSVSEGDVMAIVEAGKTTLVSLVEEEGVTLCGTVTVNGNPQKDLEVSLRPSRENEPGRMPFWGSRHSALTDPAGSYRLEGIIPGAYMVAISEKKTRTNLHNSEMEITGGQTNQRDFDIEASSLSVVILSAQSRQPVQGASLMLHLVQSGQEQPFGPPISSPIQTDKNGRTRVDFIKPGKYTVRTWKSNYASSLQEITIRSGENEISLLMDEER